MGACCQRIYHVTYRDYSHAHTIGIPESERNQLCRTPRATEWVVAGNRFQKVNDYYIYNAFWFMIVTSTSVGYGDVVATTSPGRLVAAFSALVGLIFVSLLTASMANMLQFSGDEASANVILKREVARLHRREMAAYMLQVWWHRRRPGSSTKSKKARQMNLMHLSVQLKKLTMEACQEIEDAAGFSTKIDQSYKQLKVSEVIISHIGQMLWYEEFLDRQKASRVRSTSTLKTS